MLELKWIHVSKRGCWWVPGLLSKLLQFTVATDIHYDCIYSSQNDYILPFQWIKFSSLFRLNLSKKLCIWGFCDQEQVDNSDQILEMTAKEGTAINSEPEIIWDHRN